MSNEELFAVLLSASPSEADKAIVPTATVQLDQDLFHKAKSLGFVDYEPVEIPGVAVCLTDKGALKLTELKLAQNGGPDQ